MKTIFSWVFGVALLGLVIIYPLSLIYAIYESLTKKDISHKRSYKYGWFNQRWK